jgi:hypothetical protein
MMDGDDLEYEHRVTLSPLLPSMVLTIPPVAETTIPVCPLPPKNIWSPLCGV